MVEAIHMIEKLFVVLTLLKASSNQDLSVTKPCSSHATFRLPLLFVPESEYGRTVLFT